jgi:hypothetical protein
VASVQHLAQPPDGAVDWQFLRERLWQTSWSYEAREAGDWALSMVEEIFGPRWPPAWKGSGSAPPEFISCWWSLAGLIGTVRMALAFTRLRDCEGVATLAKRMKRGTEVSRHVSPRLQLNQAALARAVGYEIRLEPLLAGAETAADLEIRSKGSALGVEAFALLRDDRSLQASAWVDEVREELRLLGEQLTVDIHGVIEEVPVAVERTRLLTELRRHVELSARGLVLPPFRSGGVAVAVNPGEGRGATSFRMPEVSFGERLGNRLAKKARQAARSRANWLLIDSLDHLWHMTAWSQQSLGTKAQHLATLMQNELRHADHILGVTITGGAALMRRDGREETLIREDYVAMTRRSDAWHVRESVIVPLQPAAEQGMRLWRAMLEAESGWLESELRRNGLIAPPELRGHTGR